MSHTRRGTRARDKGSPTLLSHRPTSSWDTRSVAGAQAPSGARIPAEGVFLWTYFVHLSLHPTNTDLAPGRQAQWMRPQHTSSRKVERIGHKVRPDSIGDQTRSLLFLNLVDMKAIKNHNSPEKSIMNIVMIRIIHVDKIHTCSQTQDREVVTCKPRWPSRTKRQVAQHVRRWRHHQRHSGHRGADGGTGSLPPRWRGRRTAPRVRDTVQPPQKPAHALPHDPAPALAVTSEGGTESFVHYGI